MIQGLAGARHTGPSIGPLWDRRQGRHRAWPDRWPRGHSAGADRHV